MSLPLSLRLVEERQGPSFVVSDTVTVPQPTFIVANGAAPKQMWLANTAVDLSDEDYYLWGGAEGFQWPLIPQSPGHAAGSGYGVPTDATNTTFAVYWVKDGGNVPAGGNPFDLYIQSV